MALAAGLYLIETLNMPIDNQGDPITTEPLDPSPGSPGAFTLPALLFPSLVTATNVDPHGRAAAAWHKACQNGPHPIRPVYRFPRGMPAGLFERATVRLNWPEELKVGLPCRCEILHFRYRFQLIILSFRLIIDSVLYIIEFCNVQ